MDDIVRTLTRVTGGTITITVPAALLNRQVEVIVLPHKDVQDTQVLPPNGQALTILDRAVQLQRQRKLRVADALIAVTVLHYGPPLVTRNADDFSWITGLEVVNPFAEAGTAW